MIFIQFGFRPRLSTQEALLSITNSWHSLLTKHRQAAAVFLDVKKAFDSVPHCHLIKALHSIGIQGRLLNWFRDYLTSRFQHVILDGHLSSAVPVTSSVPQGSILGLPLSLVKTPYGVRGNSLFFKNHSKSSYLKTSLGLRRSDPLRQAKLCLLATLWALRVFSCSLLAFPLSVSLVSSCLRCLRFSVFFFQRK